MPVQIAGRHSIARARRAVLLTGASGVVGRALLQRLHNFDVVCLVHRSPVSGPNVTAVPGDIAKPMLGLGERAYAALTARVDAVIHCAAVTEFNRTDGSLEATNIAGTEHIAAFTAAAGAVLYHVSTAFVDTTADGDRGHTAIGYASSKSAAEQVVRSSGVPHVILRPSVVIGDSDTGEIAAFQGLHHDDGQPGPGDPARLLPVDAQHDPVGDHDKGRRGRDQEPDRRPAGPVRREKGRDQGERDQGPEQQAAVPVPALVLGIQLIGDRGW